MSISIGTVASRVFLSDQLCPVAFILQVLKAGNVSYQLYPLLLYSESCIWWWCTQTRMKTRDLTFRQKQAIWILKEKRKSIRAIAKKRGMEKSRVWKRPATRTTTWSAEKTTVVKSHKIIKAVKMNPKRRVCEITNNFQKARAMLWQSTVLKRLWHRIADATVSLVPVCLPPPPPLLERTKGPPEINRNYPLHM